MPWVILIVIGGGLFFGYVFLLLWLITAIAAVALGPLLIIATIAAFGCAMVMPIVLLLAPPWREARDRQLRTPEEVRAGSVVGRAPRGEMAGHGWDHAWPTYFPYQAMRDFSFVSTWMWQQSVRFFNIPVRWTSKLWNMNTGALRWLWWLPVIGGMLVTAGIALWIYAALTMMFTTVFTAILWVVMTVLTGVSHLFGAFYGGLERSGRRRAAKELSCENCYRTTYVPGYRCPECAETHRLLRPGPLGIFRRVCHCGTVLPSTATRAAAKELTVVCPYCDAVLGATAGARPTVLVPIIGPVGAGKTTFFASAVRGMRTLASEQNGSFAALNGPARQFVDLAQQGGVLPKTAVVTQPEVMTFEAALGSEPHEVQLVDAAGEHFVSQESTDKLSYIDASAAWIFVLDPLMLPEVRSRLEENAVDLGDTQVGSGDLTNAYKSVIERLKATSVSLKKKSLAVVVTKADLLVQVPDWSDLGSSESVKDMLLGAGAHNLVQGAEFDFGDRLVFFATESRTREGLDPRRDPVRVIDWALSSRGVRLSFLRGPVTPAVDTE